MEHPIVLCYGVIGVDELISVAQFPERDGHARVLHESRHAGGEGANSASTLAGLGAGVRLAGNRIGDDLRGRFLLGELDRVPGLDVSRVEVAAGTETSHALIVSDSDGARTILGAFAGLSAPELHGEAFDDVQLLSVDPFLGPEAEAAARVAVGKSIPVVSIELTAEHPMATLCDVVINSSGFGRRHGRGDPAAVADRLLRAGVRTFILTKGSDGCRVYEQGQTIDVPAFDVDAADTTGAGDAFRAGFIWAHLEGYESETAARLGSAAAAVVCRFPGGFGNLSGPDEVLRLACIA